MSRRPDIFARNVPGTTERLQHATVGIAGCGGLGSNAAVALARAGVGTFILADFDMVETSNLNRQHYFQTDIGRKKVDALAAHLHAIDAGIIIDVHDVRLTPELIPVIFARADLLIEAFDRAESKRWLLRTWCHAFPRRHIVGGSGLSGVGGTDALRVHSAGHIHICGDETSDMAQGLCAPRVAIVAAMQANVAIELLLAS